MFLVISSIKWGDSDEIWCTVSWINVLQNRVNVSHLTWIMSIHYLMKLEMLIMQVLQLHCQRKKLQISPPPQPWPPNVPDLNPVEWDYCKRRCTKHVSYHWSGRTETATEMEWPRWIMSSLRQPFVSGVADSSRSEMRVLYTFCRNNPHTLLSNGFKSGECGGHCWGGINSGFSNCNNAMVARAQWAFQVLQGSVKTLFRWGGKRYISFCSNLIQQTIYQISSELPEFYRRYYKKKRFGLFFRTVYSIKCVYHVDVF